MLTFFIINVLNYESIIGDQAIADTNIVDNNNLTIL